MGTSYLQGLETRLGDLLRRVFHLVLATVHCRVDWGVGSIAVGLEEGSPAVEGNWVVGWDIVAVDAVDVVDAVEDMGRSSV